MKDFPVTSERVVPRPIDIKTTHAATSIGREVEVAVGSEGRKHLVAFSINSRAEVLYCPEAASTYRGAPEVQPAHAARHVRDEIEVSIRRHGRMSI